MARVVEDNEVIEWKERVKEPTGRNIFIKSLALYSVNGDLYNNQKPDWLSWEILNDKIKEDGSREKEIKLKVNSQNLKENITYVFEIVASNGSFETSRKVSLSVIFPLKTEFIDFSYNNNFNFKKISKNFLYFPVELNQKDKSFNLKSKIQKTGRKSNTLKNNSPNLSFIRSNNEQD